MEPRGAPTPPQCRLGCPGPASEGAGPRERRAGCGAMSLRGAHLPPDFSGLSWGTHRPCGWGRLPLGFKHVLIL